ncbi:MAG TPA: NFACT family protein, partial [Longimicrobiales bacterium]
MSNSGAVRYDSLLVRHLARELDDALRGRAASALRFDADARRASLELDDGALVLDLHPSRGRITLEAAPPAAPDIRRLHRSARVRRVVAPADERILRIELDGATSDTRPIRALVVELLTNQMNALALNDDDRIVAALWPRSAGGRDLLPGRSYVPPAASGRQALHEPLPDDAFRAFQYGRDPAQSLVRNIAWTSTLNAWALTSYDEYVRVVWGEAQPSLVRRPDGAVQPYPAPIGGDAEHTASLLDGMRRMSDDGAGAATPGVDPETIDRVRREVTRLAARVERMRAQQARALPEAAALRARGDVLLARLHEVPKGAARVTLEDFEGGTLELELDPKLSAADNARAFYDTARKRTRAAERMPALIE